MSVWIKICGTTNLPDAQASVEAGADALGFIFAESKRRIEVETAAEIIAKLPKTVETIGVFVNEDVERLVEIADAVGLSGVQLHGDESPDYIARLKRTAGGAAYRIIKGVSANDTLANTLREFRGLTDAMLIDSGSASQRGGTGKVFDWEQWGQTIREVINCKTLIVAGGLRSENVGRAIATFHPAGVDVASGVESEPGKKDLKKLQDFVAAVRASESHLK